MQKTLFWDFHGTLIKPGRQWSWNILQAILAEYPETALTLDDVRHNLDNDGFPWNHPERTYLDITRPDDWWQYIDQLLRTTLRRCRLTHDQIEPLLPQIRSRMLDPTNYELFDGTLQVLADLKQDGWKHILVSNNFPELAGICQAIGLSDFFTDYIVSALVGYDKPRPEIYQMALAAAGYPPTCFMIGDNPEADIAGAQAAGIPGILVNYRYGNEEAANLAVRRCADIRELRSFLLTEDKYLRSCGD